MIAEEHGTEHLFIASSATMKTSNAVWLVDSGCSNHMTGERSLFASLDESLRTTVRLGDDKEMEMLKVGTVTLVARNGKPKCIHRVKLVPGLVHNLLSVGQLLIKGYLLNFHEGKCVIKDDKMGKLLTMIPKGNNNMFPLDLTRIKRVNVAPND